MTQKLLLEAGCVNPYRILNGRASRAANMNGLFALGGVGGVGGVLGVGADFCVAG